MSTSPEKPPAAGGGTLPMTVGLTGGIGSGKSAAAAVFAELGVPVIDADELSRALVEPGQPALAEIVAAFGPGCLQPDGRLDRAWLRRRVFASAPARRRLEAILHPLIRSKISELKSSIEAPYCIVVIPLLLESGQADLVDRVLVIDVPEAVQVRRAAARDGVAARDIEAILRTQADRGARLAAADDVIDNTGAPEELRARVQSLHERYLSACPRN